MITDHATLAEARAAGIDAAIETIDDSPARQIEAVRLMVNGVEFHASHTTKEW